MPQAYNITDSTITVYIDGDLFQIPRSAPHAHGVEQGLKNNVSDYELRQLCTPAQAVQIYSQGRVRVSQGQVTLDGQPMPRCLETRILALMRDGLPFTYLVNFFDRLRANSSNRAVEELYAFLEHTGIPITKDGHFLAYKGVQENRYSVTENPTTRVLQGTVTPEGHIWNGDGCTIEVVRQDVDDNCTRTCSHGLHVGSYEYASLWGDVRVVVEVDPADVVSVPIDSDRQKVRVCKYKVLGPCYGRMTCSVGDPDDPYKRPIADYRLKFTKYQ